MHSTKNSWGPACRQAGYLEEGTSFGDWLLTAAPENWPEASIESQVLESQTSTVIIE
jgi:hypothetical protein